MLKTRQISGPVSTRLIRRYTVVDSLVVLIHIMLLHYNSKLDDIKVGDQSKINNRRTNDKYRSVSPGQLYKTSGLSRTSSNNYISIILINDKQVKVICHDYGGSICHESQAAAVSAISTHCFFSYIFSGRLKCILN